MFLRSAIAAAGLLAAVTAHAATDMPFALDWKFEGPSAPFFMAIAFLTRTPALLSLQ